MKKTVITAAVWALMSTAAFAAHHEDHDTSPPALSHTGAVLQTDTKVTHDKTTINKMGTTQEGSMVHTRTTPEHGTRVVSQSNYHHHTPSAWALNQELKREVSLGIGGVYSFDKDTYGDRLSNTGMAGNLQMLWKSTDHLALGLDYSILAPQHRSASGGNYRYKNLRAHNISMAGKLTFNPQHRMQIYMPMGIGASQVGLKGSGTRDAVTSSQSDHKWGVGLFAGLGMQYNLTNTVFMGLEYRYNLAFVKGDDLNRYGKDNYLDFHSAMLKVGMRF